MHKGKVKFPQIKQDTIRQESFQKYEKRCKCVGVDIRHDTPSFCMQPFSFWIIFIHPPVAYVFNWWLFSQPKNILIMHSLKYRHPKKQIYLRRINGSVGWNKHGSRVASIKNPIVKCQLCTVREHFCKNKLLTSC